MADINQVTLLGSVKKFELVNRGRHTFLDLRIQTDPSGKSLPTKVSCYVAKDQLSKYGLDKALADFKAGKELTAYIPEGLEDGDIQGDDVKFWNVKVKLSGINISTTPCTRPFSLAQVQGKIVDQSQEGDHTVAVIGTSYFSKNPQDENDRGSWKNRMVRIVYPAEHSFETGQSIFCFGTVHDKRGDDFFHHINALGIYARG